MKARVIVDIMKETNPVLVVKTNTAIVGLTGNSDYPVKKLAISLTTKESPHNSREKKLTRKKIQSVFSVFSS